MDGTQTSVTAIYSIAGPKLIPCVHSDDFSLTLAGGILKDTKQCMGHVASNLNSNLTIHHNSMAAILQNFPLAPMDHSLSGDPPFSTNVSVVNSTTFSIRTRQQQIVKQA